MISFTVAAVLATSLSGSAAAPAAPPGCDAARTEILLSSRPVVDPDAREDSVADADPTTIQMFFVDGLSEDQARVSPDAQVIYVPRKAALEEEPANALIPRLFLQAVDRRVELKFGLKCVPLEPAPSGT